MAYLSPFTSPPVPVIDNDLPYDRYSEAVRQLCLLILPTCPSFEPGEVRVVGDTPIAADGFADIWRGTHDATSIVQKSYRCYETSDVGSISQRFLGEVWVLAQLSHPNVIRFLGINPSPNHPFALVLATGGNLGLVEYLRKYPEADKLKLVLGIARGLEYLHGLEIVHGHLAPNILVDSDGTPLIAGFSSSFMISRPDLWSEKDTVGFFRGSAPELIRPHKPGGNPTVQITKASDMYAFGMLTWQIFSGRDPFFEALDVTVVHRVLKGDRPPRCVGLSNRVWKAVKACWDDKPSRRPTVGEVLALIEAEQLLSGRPV